MSHRISPEVAAEAARTLARYGEQGHLPPEDVLHLEQIAEQCDATWAEQLRQQGVPVGAPDGE